jgi:hypothetical protein
MSTFRAADPQATLVDLEAIARFLASVPGSSFTLTVSSPGVWHARAADSSKVAIAEARMPTPAEAVHQVAWQLTR